MRQFQFVQNHTVCVVYDTIRWQIVLGKKCGSFCIMVVLEIGIDIGRDSVVTYHCSCYNWIKIIGLLLVGKINLNCTQTVSFKRPTWYVQCTTHYINWTESISIPMRIPVCEEKNNPNKFFYMFLCNLPKIMHLVYLPCFMFLSSWFMACNWYT